MILVALLAPLCYYIISHLIAAHHCPQLEWRGVLQCLPLGEALLFLPTTRPHQPLCSPKNPHFSYGNPDRS